MTISDRDSGQARCRISGQFVDVEKNALNAGRWTDTESYRAVLDTRGSYLEHKESG